MIDVAFLANAPVMDTMGARLRQARIDAGHSSARAVAHKFGWKPSTYAAHENGQNDYDPPTAEVYAKHLNTSAGYLLTGSGPRYRRPPVVSSYDPDRMDIEIGAEESPEETPRAAFFPPDAIKELTAKAGLGSGQTVETRYVRNGFEITQQDAVLDDYWRIPPAFARAAFGARLLDLLVLECIGDSMSPTVNSGERVIVNTAHRRPSPDGLYAVRNQLDEVVVKRLELFGANPPRIRIISDNASHTPQECGLDEIQVVGKVVMMLKLA